MFEERAFSLKNLFLIATIFLFFCLIVYLSTLFNPKTTVVFCDVGQGDATYIRTKTGVDILIDAGSSREVLECLGKYMPFYDRTIEIGFITHPHKDHYGGFEFILDRYRMGQIIAPPIDSESSSFEKIEEKIVAKHIPLKHLYRTHKIQLDTHRSLEYLWPTKDYIAGIIGSQTVDVLESSTSSMSANTVGTQKDVLGLFTANINPNEVSHVFLYNEGDFEILFAGDITTDISDIVATDTKIGKVVKRLGLAGSFSVRSTKYPSVSKTHIAFSDSVDVLKVPHHGSNNGLTSSLLELADPSLSVISAGKKNRYGHPHKQALDLLQSHKSAYLVTATAGDIIVTVD